METLEMMLLAHDARHRRQEEREALLCSYLLVCAGNILYLLLKEQTLLLGLLLSITSLAAAIARQLSVERT